MKFIFSLIATVAAYQLQQPKFDKGNDMTPACSLIKCLEPFVLRRGEGQCCPTCFADDKAVPLDRHTAFEGENPYLTEKAPGAPPSCKNVKCFTPVCLDGQEPGPVPGRCCYGCK